MALVEGKQADPDVQLDVDEMIMDYLLYVTIKTLLEEFSMRLSKDEELPPLPSGSDLTLQMVDSFLHGFKVNHSSNQISSTVKFRLHLLQFTTILTRRLYISTSTPPLTSLMDLRRLQNEHASAWLVDETARNDVFNPSCMTAFSDSAPLSPCLLKINRNQALTSHHLPSAKDEFYGLETSTSLLDTLPAFMALSSAGVKTTAGWSITTAWMDLAAEYALQAAVEQYLVYGAHGPQALRNAFAWGYDERSQAREGSEEREIHDFFQSGGEETIQQWRAIRDEHLNRVIPDGGDDLHQHLKHVSQRFPLHEFEAKLLEFLKGLTTIHPKPILIQLESGKLDEMTTEETEAFKALVGL
ncbi:MAG: hypothetical protein M1837_005572 [Sclerophora amabilis]|nr:MAG: hypothetical protein M1837_005572 [Sclerophora amabilis]